MEPTKFSSLMIVAMVLVLTYFTLTPFALNHEVASMVAETWPVDDHIQVASKGDELDLEDHFEVASATADPDHGDYYDNIMVKNGSIISTGLIPRRVDGCSTSICNILIIPCKIGCVCVPFGVLPFGFCIGFCQDCNFTPPAPSPQPKPPSPPQSFSSPSPEVVG